MFIFLLSSMASANIVLDDFISKAADTLENKMENAANDISNNVEIDLSGFSDGKPSYGISTLLPLYNENNRNSFLQGHISTQAHIEMFNLGYVQRYGFLENKLVAGFNIFYDYDLEHSHERMSIGTDLLTSLGDIHLNYYDAITNFRVVDGKKEYTLDGYDVQFALPLPYLPKSKLYAELFSWNGINSSRDLEGESYSIKNELPYGISLELGKKSYDQLAQDEEFINLNLNFYNFKNNRRPLSEELAKMYSIKPYEVIYFNDVSDRKFEKVRRENKIKKQTSRTGTVRIAGY